MKKIGIYGSEKNIFKLSEQLSEHLKEYKDVIIEIYLPEGRNLFGYDDKDILNSIANNDLGIFRNNKSKIESFMDRFNNVRVFCNVSIANYYPKGNKHIVDMHTNRNEDSPIKREFDFFIFADKIFTTSSTLTGITSDHSLDNVVSIHEYDKVEWLFSKTSSWTDSESIVLVGSDLKTFNFAINLKRKFKNLDIKIINMNHKNNKPLMGYTFGYVEKSLVKRAVSMGINVYLNVEILEREIDFNSDLVSSILIHDIDAQNVLKIDTEIILVINNIAKEDVLIQNSYLINKLSKLSGMDDYPLVKTDEYLEVKNLDNFYFVNSLIYKKNELTKVKQENTKKLIQWYEVENSYTHIFAIVTSILSKITRDKNILIPINEKILDIENTSINCVGLVSDDPKDLLFIVNGGNNIKMINNSNIQVVKTGILVKEHAIINIGLFVNTNTEKIENYLLDVRILNFNADDSDEEYNKKLSNVKNVKKQLSMLLSSFKLGQVLISDVLIQLVNYFGSEFVLQLSDVMLNFKEILADSKKEILFLTEGDVEKKFFRTKEYVDMQNRSVYEFNFDETFEQRPKILIKILKERRKMNVNKW